MQQEIYDSISQGIIIVNNEGLITLTNRAAEKLLNINKQDTLLKPIDTILPGTNFTGVITTNMPLINQKIIVEQRQILLSLKPLLQNGQVEGAVYILEDISSSEQMAKELVSMRQLKEDLEAIFDSSYDEIFVIDGQGIVTKVNKIAETYYDVKPHQIIGQNVLELEKQGYFKPSVTRMVLKEKRRITIAQKTISGKELIVTANPVFNQDGEIIRVVVNSRDITELNSLRQKLNETEKLAEAYRSQALKLQQSKIKSGEIIARSSSMKQLLEMVDKIAQVDSTVLITGESGVGKGIVAAQIHKLSKRKNGPFVAINCGAIPANLLESELFGYDAGAFTGARKEGKKGLIQLGDGGTVFLDEVAELPLSLQVKLLHVIQQKTLMRVGGTKEIEVNVRFIAATNRDIRQMVKDGLVREDLYYRLNVIPITIQPLRYRGDDIIPLVEHFLNIFNTKYEINKRFTPEVMESLTKYNWPGNVREVENIVERMVVTSESNEISASHLPEYIISSNENANSRIYVMDICPLDDAIQQVEKQLILKAYERFNNTYRMADALKINQSTVVRKMKKYMTAPGNKKKGRKPVAIEPDERLVSR